MIHPPSAQLRAYHDAATPDEVTEGLGVPPDRTVLAGARSHIEELGPIPSNGWFLKITGFVATDDLGSHVRWLVDFVRARLPAIDELRSVGWEFSAGTFPYLDESGVPVEDTRFLKDVGLELNAGLKEQWPASEFNARTT
ncbi:MAG: DUF4279 domain-containing protein [Chloroflexi bacterium]|nr:DUF4279 domain-containing protein [Chloroflexota bacterium]